MGKIKELTQTIRNFAESELDYRTLKTLKMIDDEAEDLLLELEEKTNRLTKGRDYLMGVNRNDLTVEDALDALGYGRNGLDGR